MWSVLKKFDLLFLVVCFCSLISDSASAKSAFERVLEKDGQVPFPFKQVTELLNAAESDDILRDPGIALVPRGRSLHREFSSFEQPRIIYSKSTLDGRVFVGFSEKAEQIEVISWDSEQQKYVFQIVSQYAFGKTAQLKSVDESLCSSCHLNGGPILSRAPWRELDSGLASVDGSTLMSKIRDARKAKELSVEEYQEIPITLRAEGLSLGEIDILDTHVRLAAQDQQLGEICKSACKNDLSCRSSILQSALEEIAIAHRVPYALSSWSLSTLIIEHLQRPYQDYLNIVNSSQTAYPKAFDRFNEIIQANWPKGHYSYPSTVLLDRDPFLSTETDDYGFRLESQRGDRELAESLAFNEYTTQFFNSSLNFGKDEKTGSGLKFNDDLISEAPISSNETDKGWMKWLNPSQVRPLFGGIPKEEAAKYIYAYASRCIWPTQRQVREAYGVLKGKFKNRLEIEEKIQNSNVQKVLELQWPPDFQKLVQTLLSESKAETKVSLVNVKVESAPKAKSSSSDLKNERAKKYCLSCHEISVRHGFKDFDQIKNYKNEKTLETALKRIDGTTKPSMPPESFLIRRDLVDSWKKDRDQMIQDLKPEGH